MCGGASLGTPCCRYGSASTPVIRIGTPARPATGATAEPKRPSSPPLEACSETTPSDPRRDRLVLRRSRDPPSLLLGHELVSGELAPMVAATLRHRADARGVPVELGFGDHRPDLRPALGRIHPHHPATATVDVAHDVTQILLGCRHLDLHD